MAATIKIPATFTARDRFSPAVKRMTMNVQGFANRASVGIARVEHRFNRLMRPLTMVQKKLGMFGVGVGLFALVGAVGGAINIFKDFEQANANLSAVMATATQPQLDKLRKDAERLGSTTAKSATEVVGLQEAFARLGFETNDIINMTEATINGSVAMNGELDQTANLVGAMIKTFEDFSSVDTPAIIDKMTASTQKSALSFEKLETSLPIVGGAANAAGVDFDTLLALLGKLSDSGIDASSSATALRNIFLESSKQGLNYSQILDKIVNEQDSLTAANDEFGKRAAVSGVILSKNIKETGELADALGDAGGAADKAAKKQLNTLDGALTILESSYQGFILSLENGNGSIGKFIKNVVKVTSEIFSLLSGAAAATNTLSGTDLKIREAAETTLFWLKAIGLLIAAAITFKVLLIASKIALAAYNVVMGIHAAITQTSRRRVIGNTVAQGAYRTMMIVSAIAIKAFTAAQWLLNAALTANPIGIIIMLIAGLIALVVLIIAKYDEWGASLALLLGPFGMIINIIQSFRRNWDMIVDAFKTGGIKAGIKAIGRVLIDALLMPMQQLLELVAKIPGMGDLAGNAAAKIAAIRDGLGVNTGSSDESEAEVLPTTNQASNEQLIERTNNSNVNLNIKDKGNNVESVEQNGNTIPINLGRGIGAFAT